jgi:hypothetical protein
MQGGGRNARALLGDERIQGAPALEEAVDATELHQELIVGGLVAPWLPPDREQAPDAAQATLLPRARQPVVGVEGRPRRLRPVESGEAQACTLAVGHRQAAERAAVVGALERDDEAAVLLARAAHAAEEHRLDGVLDRLGAGVDHEVPWHAGRRDLIERRLHPKRHRGLVFGVGVAVDRDRQLREHRLDDRVIVLAQGLRGDEGAHVQKAVRLPVRITVRGRQIRPDRLGRIEGHGERVEQRVPRSLQRLVRGGQVDRDQIVDGPIRLLEPRRRARVDLPTAIARVERRRAFEVLRDGARNHCLRTLPQPRPPGGRGGGDDR